MTQRTALISAAVALAMVATIAAATGLWILEQHSYPPWLAD